MIRPDPALFELMADRVQDYAIFLLDTDGNVMSWNRGAAAIKQYSAEEIIGRHFSTFYTPADIQREWPKHEIEVATTEGRFEDEGWRVRKDGSRFWANVIITALRDEAGTLLAYSKITRDLTQRKQQEEKLRESEERFRLLIEGVQDYAIYMLSPDGTVTSWNRGARRIKGYAANEIIGRHFSRFYPPEAVDAAKPWKELALARETGRAEDEGWRVRKDGSRFWARVVVTALHDPDGKLRGFAKVTQDMTSLLHAQSLEESAANINNFIAILAHELRNPLAPIRNAVQLQKISPAGSPAHKKALDIVERQSDQLAHIVEDLLDIARISRGTMSLELRPTSLEGVIRRAVETAQPAIDAANHRFHLDLPKKPLINLLGDDLRLNQAITNILNNAARYTEPGGDIYLSAGLHRTEGNDRVQIKIRDTGRGIAPDMLETVFGMFVQGKDITNRPSAGLGVGLALARSIIELHHGTVTARSEGHGKGTEFTITLPVESTEVDKTQDAGATEFPVAAAEPQNCRVLVVDDNEDAARMLSSILAHHGYETQTVFSGAAAIDEFEKFRPEIVLLDIGMPGMSGLDVARRLRERNRTPSPFIVAVTGWGNAEDRARSIEAGFDLHLVKPVDESRLLEALGARRRTLH